MRPVSDRLARRALSLFVCVLALAAVAGCGGGSVNTEPSAAPKPASTTPPPPPPSVVPGTEAQATQPPVAPAPQARVPDGTALATGWKYRYDMISPANSNFGVTTREVYLYFRPDTTSVGFRLENRMGLPIKIFWDESTFLDINGRTYKAVHRGVTYDTKDMPQEPTYVRPGETYADFLIPVDLLNSPEAAAGQGVRAMLPTDLSAQSMIGRVFGPNLVLGLENDARQTFEIRFKVASVYSDR
jgi:hypothetical protein